MPATCLVEWRPWSGAAFEEARAGRVPVLLSLGPHWCPGTAQMMRSAYADPAVAEFVRNRFVPVRVDPDARPDIGERYSLGGWPTTAFLTPEGEILGGETYATPQRMRELLPRVADAFAAQRDDLAGRRSVTAPHPVVPPGAEPDPHVDGWLADRLRAEFDPQHGGFGAGPKRVHAAALEIASQRARAGEDTFSGIFDRTLDAMAWGGLYDHEGGGIFRYCARRDWTEPATEKLLDVNAAALGLFLAGAGADYRERAAGVIDYVRRTLRNPATGGLFASQRGDPAYYGAAEDDREVRGAPPPVDRTVYADASASMARALARAAGALEDASLLESAVEAIEHVVAGTYERGGGIAHRAGDGSGVRGLLADQVRASAALLDLYVLTEREAYIDVAQELMQFAVRRLWDVAGGGGFLDRAHAPDDAGLLRVPVRPFTANCEAACVLVRLARITGQSSYRERALAALASQTPVAPAHGVDAAHYALALRALEGTVPGGG
ncbi:MAG: DUF255 domain-containing protein [Acidobacteria bacterium]|nr:DUF255 domain-containing protein [Acidobacteriota bacterium]